MQPPKHVKTNEQKKSGRTLMQHVANDPVISLNQLSSGEWAKLIRKLRWVGLEEEARRLELAMSAFRRNKEVVYRPDLPAPIRSHIADVSRLGRSRVGR
jgi:hypothetical protein